MSTPLLILIVIAAYFIVWLSLSYLSARGADSATFFSGNRKIPWPLVAIAMLGAPITGVTFISVPGMVISKGYSYLQMCIGFFIGYLIIAFVLIPLYYRLNIVSIYGFLQRRFGRTSYKTGAWLFLVSKILGISIRFLMVCAVLQLLVFDPLGIPYPVSVAAGLAFVWLSTFRGGVKSVIYGDILKSFCLLASIGLCLFFLLAHLGHSPQGLLAMTGGHTTSQIFFLDDPADSKFLWKQIVAGIFIVVAMTGLDQDMMQRTLACKDTRASVKNLVTGSLLQTLVIGLLLVLGTVMVMFLEAAGEGLPDKTDNLFATVAFHDGIPAVVGILFILGLVSATYSSVASALTSMTTTATVDIFEVSDGLNLKKTRTVIHTSIALLMGVLVMFFYYLNEDDAISTVYTLISYTDGPIMGLFFFGILSKRQINETWLPAVCVLAPAVSWMLQWAAMEYFGYRIGYELLIINAGLTFLGLSLLPQCSPATSKTAVGA